MKVTSRAARLIVSAAIVMAAAAAGSAVRQAGERVVRVTDFGAEPDSRRNATAAVRRAIEPQARELMADLEGGHYSSVMYALPKDQASRFRPPVLSWWERLIGSSVAGISVLSDLETMQEFSILAWPDLQAVPQLVYDSPNVIAVLYEVPYVWLRGGVSETDVLRMKLLYRKTPDGWTFFSIRLSGKAIPSS